MVCNGEPDPAMAGCYYGVLNVLDPSITYDSNGKVIGTQRLPPSDTKSTEDQNGSVGRNPPEDPPEVLENEDEHRNGADLYENYENGCYYGILNVLDPSIEYDSNGKVIGTLRLAPPDTTPKEKQIGSFRRNPPEILEDQDEHQNGASFQNNYDGERVYESDSGNSFEHKHDQETDEEYKQWREMPEKGHYEAWVENYLSTNDILRSASSDHAEHQVLKNVETFEDEENIEAELQKDLAFSSKAEALCLPISEPEQQPALKSWSDSWPQEKSLISKEIVSDRKARAESQTQTESSYWFPWTLSNPQSTTEASIESKLASVSELEPKSKVVQDSFATLPTPEIKAPSPKHQQETAEPEISYGEATPLFKTLERKNWHAVLFFLRTGSFSFNPMIGSTDMTIVKQQVRTWVTKTSFSGMEMWRQLPLHAAICFGAPQKVVESLLEAYPDAAKKPDGHGNLPLHLAFIFSADDNILAFLMRTFPASIHVMNQEGLMPIQCSPEVSSEAFQSKAELFDALSDYTRAVAENTPEKLVEQLQDVKRQLMAVNETLFGDAPPRKPEAIKGYYRTLGQNSGSPTTAAKASSGSPAYDATVEFVDLVGMGLCTAMTRSPKAVTAGAEEMEATTAPKKGNVTQQPPSPAYDATVEFVDTVGMGLCTAMASSPKTLTAGGEETALMEGDVTHQPPSIPKVGCRVKEYCPKTKKWREV